MCTMARRAFRQCAVSLADSHRPVQRSGIASQTGGGGLLGVECNTIGQTPKGSPRAGGGGGDPPTNIRNRFLRKKMKLQKGEIGSQVWDISRPHAVSLPSARLAILKCFSAYSSLFFFYENCARNDIFS